MELIRSTPHGAIRRLPGSSKADRGREANEGGQTRLKWAQTGAAAAGDRLAPRVADALPKLQPARRAAAGDRFARRVAGAPPQRQPARRAAAEDRLAHR